MNYWSVLLLTLLAVLGISIEMNPAKVYSPLAQVITCPLPL